MGNSLGNFPIRIDTDITSWRTNAAIVALGITSGVRVSKLILAVGSGGASVAGNVTITAPSDSAVLYPTLAVPAGQAANTILFTDEPEQGTSVLTWRDFAVTGVTATGTVLYLWYRV